jgi:hypothetical protein
MSQIKSPFIIVQNFLSPLQCEMFCDSVDTTLPDVDADNNPVMTKKTNPDVDKLIVDKLIDDEAAHDALMSHYDILYEGTERPTIEWFPQDCIGNKLHSENAHFTRGKWLRVHQRDLTGVIFLSDYNDKIPFDGEFEVYGGKLEFPQHDFSLNPQRGTLVIYPSGPHFINHTSKILAGEAFQIRFHIRAEPQFIYDSKNFPGDYRSWFEHVA